MTRVQAHTSARARVQVNGARMRSVHASASQLPQVQVTILVCADAHTQVRQRERSVAAAVKRAGVAHD